MDKRRFRALLESADYSVSGFSREIGVAKSTAMRWKTSVPAYAAAYAAALAVMTPEQRERTRLLARAKGFDDLLRYVS